LNFKHLFHLDLSDSNIDEEINNIYTKNGKNLLNESPSLLKFFLSTKKYQKIIIENIIDTYLNIQKDILKEFLLKSKFISSNIISICKRYFINPKEKKIYFLYKLHETSLFDYLNFKENQNNIAINEKIDILNKILEAVKFFHKNKITNLNLTFDNIKITKKKNIKICSLKNAIEIDSNNNFLQKNFSKYHYNKIFNNKINLPPEFYELKTKVIKSIYFNESNDKDENNFNIDIWSLGVIMSFIFSYKNSITNLENFYEISEYENEIESSINIHKYDIIENFYKQSKILPDILFKNINNSKINFYIKACVVGMIRYNIEERPDISDIINNIKNFSKIHK